MRPTFQSIFREEMNEYLDVRKENGFDEKSFITHLRQFDSFCINTGLSEKVFTKESADNWVARRMNEASTTHYSRINSIKHFLIFLRLKGLPVYVTRDIRFHPTNFKPHIYTAEETKKYFLEVDHFEFPNSRIKEIEIPVIFRILYCCGTRITETLSIKKKDINLKTGVITLNETKNDNQRIIVISDELNDLLKEYANKCFYLYSDNDYIFVSKSGRRLTGDIINEIHLKILNNAGIPHYGDNKGPRVHDWRSTFAVNAFRKLSDSGMDMYVALPIISAYMGHKTIYATEQYLQLTLDHFPYLQEKMKDRMSRVFDGRILYEDN